MKAVNVAIVGATGVVGGEILKILEERNFPIGSLKLLASERSAGQTIAFKDDFIDVEVLKEGQFDGIDIALFSAGGSISEKFAPIAVKEGAVVVDNTSHFRMDPDVPLVVPEVNAHALKAHKGIIANPNCSTAQMILILKALHDVARVKRVVISTYQSVSGAGKEAMQELEEQARLNLSGGDLKNKHFVKPIAFNVIPQIDSFTDNGYTKEEMKMINETQKILEDDAVKVTATTVRVPVFIGHSEALNIETEKKVTAQEARDILTKMPGVEVMDDPQNGVYPTPKELSGRDESFVGRIREDVSLENGLELWNVSDNLRKGAALNAVQIAEALLKLG